MQNRKRDTCTEQNFGLWEKTRVGCFERTASKHVYYLGWNRSPAQVGCMRQVLGPGALGRPRGMGWGGRREGGSGWGTHVNPWLIHVDVWQNPLQYYKVISFQQIKINGKKKKKREPEFGKAWNVICGSSPGVHLSQVVKGRVRSLAFGACLLRVKSQLC